MPGLFAGTLIEKIEEMVAAGDFSALKIHQPVQPGDTVIGVMTELEKALFAMMIINQSKVNLVCGACSHKCFGFCNMRLEMDKLQSQVDALVPLSWNFIEERLGKFGGTLNLRQGFQIVETAPPKIQKERIGVTIIEL
jgi:hypothetical protein